RMRQPVEFALFSSTTRLRDKPGDLIEVDPTQLLPLPPIRTVVSAMRSGKDEPTTTEVGLRARLSEIGTLDVSCVDEMRQRSWKLEFDVRPASRPVEGAPATVSLGEATEEATITLGKELLHRVFAPQSSQPALEPTALMRELEEAFSLRRDQWPLPMLRAL